MNSPENLVKNFILAYESWNDASFLASKNGENGRYESMKIAKESYQILINTYCSKNVIPQGISFGSKSNHCLESEKIISSALSDYKAVIATKNTDTNGFVSSLWIACFCFILGWTGRFNNCGVDNRAFF